MWLFVFLCVCVFVFLCVCVCACVFVLLDLHFILPSPAGGGNIKHEILTPSQNLIHNALKEHVFTGGVLGQGNHVDTFIRAQTTRGCCCQRESTSGGQQGS